MQARLDAEIARLRSLHLDRLNVEIARLRGLHQEEMKKMSDNFADLIHSSFIQVNLQSGHSVSLLTEHAAEFLYCHPATFEKFKSMAVGVLTTALGEMKGQYEAHLKDLEDDCRTFVEMNLSQLSESKKKRGAMRLAGMLFAKAKGAQVAVPEIKAKGVRDAPGEEDRLREEAEELVEFDEFASKSVREGGLEITIPGSTLATFAPSSESMEDGFEAPESAYYSSDSAVLAWLSGLPQNEQAEAASAPALDSPIFKYEGQDDVDLYNDDDGHDGDDDEDEDVDLYSDDDGHDGDDDQDHLSSTGNTPATLSKKINTSSEHHSAPQHGLSSTSPALIHGSTESFIKCNSYGLTASSVPTGIANVTAVNGKKRKRQDYEI